MGQKSTFPFDWILFDADNTLFDFHASSKIAFHNSFQHHGMPSNQEQYDRFRHFNMIAWKAFDENRMDHKDIKSFRFTRLFEEMGISELDPLAFNALYFRQLVENIRYVEGAREILSYLSDKVKIGLITNGMKEVQRPRLMASDIHYHFDMVVVSGEIGYSKPNSSYFEHVYMEMGEPQKERVLVVGDNIIADIKGGKSFGYKTAWFNPFGAENQNGVEPDFEISKLDEIREIVNSDFNLS